MDIQVFGSLISKFFVFSVFLYKNFFLENFVLSLWCLKVLLVIMAKYKELFDYVRVHYPVIAKEAEDSLPLCVDVVRSHSWGVIHNDFKVGQYSLSGELLAVHDGIRGASASTGVCYSGIWACVMGRTKKCNGFLWKKIE